MALINKGKRDQALRTRPKNVNHHIHRRSVVVDEDARNAAEVVKSHLHLQELQALRVFDSDFLPRNQMREATAITIPAVAFFPESAGLALDFRQRSLSL